MSRTRKILLVPLKCPIKRVCCNKCKFLLALNPGEKKIECEYKKDKK